MENVLPAGADTLLSISYFGNMLYQARGATQSLTVIGEATQSERTINGTLIDMSAPQFRKYASTINVGSEVNAPPLDGVFPGMEVIVDCAASLCYLTSGGLGPHHRTEVPGTSHTQGEYTFYRPRLTMMIKSVEQTFDEWKNVVGWTLVLEEI